MTSGRLPEVENNPKFKLSADKVRWLRLQEVVIYERFQYKALTENIFGVLGRWSLIGGGRTWKFDCIKRHVLTARPS